MGLNSRNALDILRRFLNSQLAGWEWDDFVGVSHKDPEVERLRTICLQAKRQYPAGPAGEWCGPEGMEMIRKAIATATGS
jgi:L-ribulose-5-phosphate 3-epimerase UlaE